MEFIADPKHWRERAEHMRLAADLLNDESEKARMLKIAEGCESLRRQSEECVAKQPTWTA
ncbi:MAG: hypothetical protein JO134_20255 [Xanthobacteraceae bacterium]|nr:hypothetical protein [Xanthobacteraceae bacterium]